MQTRHDFAGDFGRAARGVWQARALSCLLLLVLGADPVRAFDFEDVATRAQQQALRPYKSESRKPPAELLALTYHQYRDIRFRPDHALCFKLRLSCWLLFFYFDKCHNELVRMN